ncbi:MAG TPA: tetratricopeptide repeat protein [Actinomycetota bacterium]|nr:tetratricopeptide repeat protein [Actinomycetota bacterium]
MPARKPRTPRPPRKDRGDAPESVHLAKEVVEELRATARPGKGEILVKVFADAVTAFAAGDYTEAIRLGEQAKHMALRAVGPREFLGLAYYSAGKFPEAARELAAFRRLSGSTDQNPVLADCYRAMGKPDKAIDYCNEVLGSSPPDIYFEANIVAAGALTDQGRIDEAIAQLERLELRPEVAEAYHVRAWYVLADLLERKGRFTQAREWFEAAAAADPEGTDADERALRLQSTR